MARVPDLLTIAETAERLRVSARTVEREIAAGRQSDPSRTPIAPQRPASQAGGLRQVFGVEQHHALEHLVERRRPPSRQ